MPNRRSRGRHLHALLSAAPSVRARPIDPTAGDSDACDRHACISCQPACERFSSSGAGSIDDVLAASSWCQVPTPVWSVGARRAHPCWHVRPFPSMSSLERRRWRRGKQTSKGARRVRVVFSRVRLAPTTHPDPRGHTIYVDAAQSSRCTAAPALASCHRVRHRLLFSTSTAPSTALSSTAIFYLFLTLKTISKDKRYF